MAIRMDDLRPIIEPLLNDENSATIIESISKIDTEPEADIDSAVKAAQAELNESWNKRFKETFMSGVKPADPGTDPAPAPEPEPEPEPEPDAGPTTFEELFKEGK